MTLDGLQTREYEMNRKHYIGNAILWAAAIVASAIAGVPPMLSALLLPGLAATALLITWPKSGNVDCRA